MTTARTKTTKIAITITATAATAATVKKVHLNINKSKQMHFFRSYDLVDYDNLNFKKFNVFPL